MGPGEDVGDMDLEDLGGEDFAAGEPGEEGGEEEDTLLATPGRRDDGHISVYEKSKYVRKDNWNDKRSAGESGPRRRKIKNSATPEKPRGKSMRSTRPDGVISDVRFGLQEEVEPTYSVNERTLFEQTSKVRRLVEQIEMTNTRRKKAEEVTGNDDEA